jgi:hypothetical protein
VFNKSSKYERKQNVCGFLHFLSIVASLKPEVAGKQKTGMGNFFFRESSPDKRWLLLLCTYLKCIYIRLCKSHFLATLLSCRISIDNNKAVE